MASEQKTLAAMAVPGLSPDSLGNYLASLGLLRVLARCRPTVRAVWRDGAFYVIGGPTTLDELLDELSDIAERRAWTPYERGWGDAQKKSTKAKSGVSLALWQASAEEGDLELLAAHVVPAARVSFNPVLGSGGNAGKRDFSDGWRRAIYALAPSAPSDAADAENERREKRAHLKALLLGEPVTWMLDKLNAASWFSDANKLYNSGQRPFRDGGVSPWAMALACEGLAFLAGGASRRLGARARAAGAFPFVTRASAPCAGGEAGRDLAEVWAPLWDRPMTVREAQALFARGRAEVRGRGVLTPSAFATAILRRGVDAGIAEFRRFVLGRTTSRNTFEPRFEGALRVRTRSYQATSESASFATTASTAFERLLALIDQFPADRKVGKRWRFVGLRGPLEAAMLRAASAPSDPEAGCAVLDAAVAALDRVDRTRAFRKRQIAWQPLPVAWAPALFGDEAPGLEARLALACVSAFPIEYPLALYRFGVDLERGRFVHADRPPARWVWRPGPLAPVLSDVVHRRTVDWEAARDDMEPIRFPMPVASAHVDLWLNGRVDDELLGSWLSRLALFDWRFVPSGVRTLATPGTGGQSPSGSLCLFGLLAPLFDLRPVSRQPAVPTANLLPRECGARTPGAARALVNLLRSRQVEAAVRLATSRYAMAGAALVRSAVQWDVEGPERLIASLLFPVFDHERAALVERWLQPRRDQGELVYA